MFSFAQGIAPIYPIWERDAQGNIMTNPTTGENLLDWGDGDRKRPYNTGTNPYNTMINDIRETTVDNLSARVYGEVKFLKDFKFTANLSIDNFTTNKIVFQTPIAGDAKDVNGRSTKESQRYFVLNTNQLLSWIHRFNSHNVDVLLGHEVKADNVNYLGARKEQFYMPGNPELNNGADIKSASSYKNDYRLEGFFGRVQYDYNDKYYLSGSYRRDGSSKFHPDNRWGNFWSLGASWRVDREEFMQNTADWLSALTLKASYGAQGNDNLGTYYASSGLYSIVSQAGENALVSDRLATPDLKWETNLNLNVGIDFSLFNNRFSGSFDFFQRRSKDLLYSRPLATSLGYTSMDENIGALKNTGFEIDLKGTLIHTRDFMWRMGLNLTHYKNVVTELPLDDMPVTGVTRLKVGRSVYDFYLREWAGVDPANGDPLWYKNVKDAQGNITGRTTTNDYAQADYYYVDKSSLPKVYGGFNTAFAYKGFELSAIFAYSIGGYIVDRDVTMLWSNGSNPGRAWSTEILKRWTPENRDTDVPALRTVSNNWNSNSTRNLFNNSYLRMKNITLSYDFPQPLIKKVSLNSLQLFVQADNLLTFSKNQGLDPEQGITGLTYYRYPAMRSISGGINVSF